MDGNWCFMLTSRSCFSPAVGLICLLVGLTLIADCNPSAGVAATHMFLLLSMALLLWHIMKCKNYSFCCSSCCCGKLLMQLLLLLIGLSATDKVAAKPSACCGAYKERPFCFAKEQRKPTQTPSPLS
jgi:hypothetical protein